MRKLTIGMCVYDDYDGVFFSIQALRMYQSEVMDQVEFVIVDNNPTSESGQAVKEFTKSITQPVQYVEFTNYNSTSIKNKVFELADTPYVLCMDCHVLLAPGSLQKLIDFYDKKLDNGNLLQGPLLYDNLKDISTNFNRVWGEGMQGQWETDDRYEDINSEPFEIKAQGMGLFSCRKNSWLGFHKLFRGFGGEEVYIHDKYRSKGKKTICLPFMLWVHRFTRINGASYPNNWEDRYRNYMIGRIELGLDAKDVDEAFEGYLDEQTREQIKADVIEEIVSYNACNMEGNFSYNNVIRKSLSEEEDVYNNLNRSRVVLVKKENNKLNNNKDDTLDNTTINLNTNLPASKEANTLEKITLPVKESKRCGCRNSN